LVPRAADSRGVATYLDPVVNLPAWPLLHFSSSSATGRNRLGWPTTRGCATLEVADGARTSPPRRWPWYNTPHQDSNVR
jgi:hypothetical protein